MTLLSRQELLKEARKDYWRASKQEKTRLLNDFVHHTGYHRKYALALLKGRYSHHKATTRRRQRLYLQAVTDALVLIWTTCDYIASRRLHPFLGEMVEIMERQGTLTLSSETRSLLLQVSRATMDRLLKPARRARAPHGRSTTKRSTLLRQSIPLRTWADWAGVRPGYMQIDLAAHCGESTEGHYLATLDCVDVCTGWCECLVPANRGEQAVLAALAQVRQGLPFPLRGIHSDNGGEFINKYLLAYCTAEKLDSSRGRAYKKNDQAYVEGKNWMVVRRHVGYDRYEGEMARLALNALYKDLRLYVNFFQPVMKLIEKKRVDGKVKKVYDTAQTPYQRILASPDVSQEDKDRLTVQYHILNPVVLHASVEKQLRAIWERYANRPVAE